LIFSLVTMTPFNSSTPKSEATETWQVPSVATGTQHDCSKHFFCGEVSKNVPRSMLAGTLAKLILAQSLGFAQYRGEEGLVAVVEGWDPLTVLVWALDEVAVDDPACGAARAWKERKERESRNPTVRILCLFISRDGIGVECKPCEEI
jgi:hypothetical protein